MSIAKLLTGQKPDKSTAPRHTESRRRITPRELIDAIAESEFLNEEDGVGKPADGSQPETGRLPKGKGKKGDVAKGKKTPGQVAPSPSNGDPVKYGKK